MKLDSPLFNRIRVKPEPARKPVADAPVCQWPGCACEGTHRAPKGRLRENQYWRFCLDHVREYNHSYNYFAGMSDEAVARFQKDALTGHRPTWKLGQNGKQPNHTASPRFQSAFGAADDPFGVYTELGGQARTRSERPARTVRNAERKALDA